MNAASLRVLHVVDSLASGGMENGIVNVANALQPRGVEMHVACLARRGQFADRMPQPRFVRELGKRSGFSPVAMLRLAVLMTKLRPEIVHTHNLGPLIYAGLATLDGRTQRVIHGEHSMLTPEEKTPRRLAQRRRLYRACRAVHTVSSGMVVELQSLGLHAKRMFPILNGVDTRRFAPGSRQVAREQLGLPNDAEILGIVARFGEHKGHQVLLEAFTQLAPHRPKLHLAVAGSGGPQEAPFKAAVAENPFRDRIHLTGFVSHPERIYPALDLLVIPSTNEGLSNVALEGMACGVPVLGNIGCGHEEIIEQGQTGWISDLRSPETLATALGERLADPELLVQCGRRARARVETRFSLTQMAEAYEALYRSACPTGGAKATH